MTEKQLIIKCKRREAQAQRLLFDSHYQTAYQKVNGYLKNHHDTEDVVVKVFNLVFEKLHSFEYRGEGSVGRWINTIAIHQAINYLKKKNPIEYIGDSVELEAFQETEEELNYNDVPIDRIMSAVHRMPDGYRTIFLLNAVDGYTHQEISEMLGISRNTSKSQYLKAKRHLRKNIKKNING